MTLSKWLRQADIDDGARPGRRDPRVPISSGEPADPAVWSRRMRSCACGRYLSQANLPGKRLYPLVEWLAADGIPLAVTCRVLKARPPALLPAARAHPVTDTELEAAYRANALFDAHRDDPEFGYRFLADEARDAGVAMANRTAWRICSDNGWWSAFGKKTARSSRKKPGPPVHDDLVRRVFSAQARTSCGWPTSPSIGRRKGSSTCVRSKMSSPTGSSGNSIDHRMKSRIAVAALNNAVARRVRCCGLPTSHGPRISISFTETERALNSITWSDPWVAVGAAGDNAAMESFFSLLQKNVLNRRTWRRETSCASPSSPGSSGPITVVADKTHWVA